MAGTVLRKLSTRNSLSRCSDNHVRSFCALHINSQVPAGYPLEAAGPIFCAGITMWVSVGTSLSQFASGSCYWNNCSEVFLSFWSTAYTLILRFSPLCNWGVKDGGKRVGIVGIGGLGQMGVGWIELSYWVILIEIFGKPVQHGPCLFSYNPNCKKSN